MIIELARRRFTEILSQHDIFDRGITITCKALSPEEAIGNPLQSDYPVQRGKERIVEADFMGSKGQAFTDAYFNYRGKVSDLVALDLTTNARRAIFISSLNAIMASLGKISPAVHCRDQDPVRCADHFLHFVNNLSLKTDKVLLVGLQPRLLEQLTKIKKVRVCDLDPDMIGTSQCGVVIDGATRFAENAQWAGAIFSTGSAIVNGTIDEILKADRDTYFYGVTITGVASLLGLQHFCFITGAM